MNELINKSILTDRNWFNHYFTIYNNVDNLLFSKPINNNTPAIIYYFLLLNFFRLDDYFVDLFTKVYELTDKRDSKYKEINYLINSLYILNNNQISSSEERIHQILNDETLDQWIKELGYLVLAKIKKKSGQLLNLKIDFDKIMDPLILWLLYFDYSLDYSSIGDWDNFDQFYCKLLNITENNKLSVIEIVNKLIKGIHSQHKGDINQALEIYKNLIPICQTNSEKEIKRTAKYFIGIINRDLGNYSEANSAFLETIKLASSVSEKLTALVDLGFSYWLQGDFNNSTLIFNKLENEYQNIGNKFPSKKREAYTLLSIALNKYSQGYLHQSFPYFNSALEIFTQINDENAILFIHGNIAKIFHTSREYSSAEYHFKKVVQKRYHFHSIYNYQFSYINCLIDQKKIIEAKFLLEETQISASKNSSNKLIKIWYKFILALFDIEEFNFKSASVKLNTIIEATKVKGPFEILHRSLLLLVELNLRKFVATGNIEFFNKSRIYLFQSDSIINDYPIYPINIFIKLYLGMFSAYLKEKDSVEIYLADAQNLLNKSGQTSLKKAFKIIIEQIEKQKLLPGDLIFQIIHTLSSGSRSIIQHNVNLDDIGVILWKFSQYGHIKVGEYIPETLIPQKKTDNVINYMGPMLSGLLGQGDQYHQGIFGPLPVPLTNNTVNSILSTRVIVDLKQEDLRLKKTNYVILAILMKKGHVIDELSLIETLNIWWKDLNLNNFKIDQLKELIKILNNITYKLI